MDQPNNNRQNNIVDKIVSGARASMTDEPLTPARKIEAEMRRMKNPVTEQDTRGEEDRQVANLGGDILTPQKKMDRARLESQNRLKPKE